MWWNMRSYIFTDHERTLIRRLLNGEIDVKDRAIHVLISRVKLFKRLSEDVELYLRLREAISASST